MSRSKPLTKQNRELLATCWTALEDTKAENILVLDVAEQSSITNYLVLATANSNPHLKALKRDLDKALKTENVGIVGRDSAENTGWSVVDAFEVMIHIMTEEMRDTYQLETLWKDAKPVSKRRIFPTAKK